MDFEGDGGRTVPLGDLLEAAQALTKEDIEELVER